MNAERLQGLESRQDNTNIAVYSTFMRSLKIFMPLAALALVGILIIWPQLSSFETTPIAESDLQALQEANTENRLLQPVFNTKDDKNRPLTITAEEAVQRKSNADIVELNTPVATMQDTQDQTTTLSASQGTYDQNKKVMVLKDNVKITDTRQNVLETEELTADIPQSRVYNDVPTTLTTPDGVIQGQGIIIENNGAKTIFKGPAKAVIQ